MDTSGQAAEQVVRYSLEGMEYTLKLAGKGTERLAAILLALSQSQKKLKGKITLHALLRTQKELKVFSIPDPRLKAFAKEAKCYGVLYCVLKEKHPGPDALCDILVRAEDAAKINRIIERLGLAQVAETVADQPLTGPDQEVQEAQTAADMLDEILSPMEPEQENPIAAQTEASALSGPGSTPSAPDIEVQAVAQMTEILGPNQRPSVRAALAQIRMEQQQNPLMNLAEAEATALRQITEITEGVK